MPHFSPSGGARSPPSAGAISDVGEDEADVVGTALSSGPARAARRSRHFSLMHSPDPEAQGAPVSPRSQAHGSAFPALHLPPPMVASPPARVPAPVAAFGRRQTSLLREGPGPSPSASPSVAPAPATVGAGRSRVHSHADRSGPAAPVASAASPLSAAMSPSVGGARPTAGRVRSHLVQPGGAASPASASAAGVVGAGDVISPSLSAQLARHAHARAPSALLLDEPKDKVAARRPVQRGFGSTVRK
jgi:hypothetical protein